MKKSIISGISVITLMLGAANANEQACNNSVKTIWDAKDQVCVPKDPCHSKLYKNNNRYCNTVFSRTQVGDVETAQRLINLYVQAALNSKGHCKEFLPVNGDGEPKHVGDDYIGCVTREGAFVSFQFDDVSERFNKVADGNYYRAACEVLGGTPDGAAGGTVVGTAAAAGGLAASGMAAPVVAAAVATGSNIAQASISSCVGITKKQCDMIDPMAGYNENTKLCQFVR